MKKIVVLMLAMFSVMGSVFAAANSAKALQINLPQRKGYATQIKGADGAKIFEMTGQPNRGKRNGWATAIAALPIKNPANKVVRLQGDIKVEKLTQGQFWVVIREVTAANKSICYQGIFLKKDCPWTTMKKDIKIHANAAKLMVFAVGVNMPAGSKGQVKNLTVQEIQK